MIEAIIKEGGTTRVFANRAKLEVSLQGGGTTFFVPESETRLTTKRIEKNGIYKASDDGDYGWSTVTVAVSTTDSVTGTGADGKEHNYSVDGSGALVDQVVPSEIRITTPPNYVGPYGDGAILSFDGIVVHAYDALGNDMGEVPFNELAFPVTVADYDPNGSSFPADIPEYADSGTEQITSYASPLATVYTAMGQSGTREIADFSLLAAAVSGYNCPCIVYATTIQDDYQGWSPVTVYLFTDLDVGDSIVLGQQYNVTEIETFGTNSSGNVAPAGEPIYITNIRTTTGKVIAVEGMKLDTVYSSYILSSIGLEALPGHEQDIPVEWSRTGDGLVLDTSFGVSVVPGPSGSGEEGGNASAVIPIEI